MNKPPFPSYGRSLPYTHDANVKSANLIIKRWQEQVEDESGKDSETT